MEVGGCFYPTFLFFEFLKNGCKYQIQIWHACKANKMPSDQRCNEDINAESEFEICKKLFFCPDSDVVGVKTPTLYNQFSVHILEGFDISMLFYDHFRLMKALKVGCYNIRFARIDSRWWVKTPPPP